jgi:hypothetical protein
MEANETDKHIVTLTRGEADAVGYALMGAIRRERERAIKYPDDAHAEDLIERLHMAYIALDRAPKV